MKKMKMKRAKIVNKPEIDNLSSRVSQILGYHSTTNLALFYNTIPDENCLPYGKSTFTIDLQHIGYTFVRSILSDAEDASKEIASYFIGSPAGFTYQEFRTDMINLAEKYNVNSFVVVSKKSDLPRIFKRDDRGVYDLIDRIEPLDTNQIVNLMLSVKSTSTYNLRTSLIDPAWGPKTRVYRTDHNRNDVFGMYPDKPYYDTPLNWEPTPWES